MDRQRAALVARVGGTMERCKGPIAALGLLIGLIGVFLAREMDVTAVSISTVCLSGVIFFEAYAACPEGAD